MSRDLTMVQIPQYQIEQIYTEMKKMEAQLKEAEEVIGFYGDPDKWTIVASTCCSSMLADDHELTKTNKERFIAGRNAREYMAKYGVLE